MFSADEFQVPGVYERNSGVKKIVKNANWLSRQEKINAVVVSLHSECGQASARAVVANPFQSSGRCVVCFSGLAEC